MFYAQRVLSVYNVIYAWYEVSGTPWFFILSEWRHKLCGTHTLDSSAPDSSSELIGADQSKYGRAALAIIACFSGVSCTAQLINVTCLPGVRYERMI